MGYYTLASLGIQNSGGAVTTEILYSALLVVCAFWLGACPFSVWVGRWRLGKDIRGYGDGNPGATNVFRAGDTRSGLIALALDIAKGVPFVFIAHSLFGLPEMMVMTVGLCAILGHAFSPLLRLRGGKALAVTFGVLLALPQHEMLIAFLAFMVLGFLFIEIDAWTAMLGPAGSLAYLATTGTSQAQALFMLCVLIILAIKHFDSLKTVPRFKVKPLTWLQSGRRGT